MKLDRTANPVQELLIPSEMESANTDFDEVSNSLVKSSISELESTTNRLLIDSNQ